MYETITTKNFPQINVRYQTIDLGSRLGSYIFLTVHLPPVLLDGEGQHVLLKMAEPTCNQQCALPLHLAVDVNSVQDPWDERGEITETSETSQTL